MRTFSYAAMELLQGIIYIADTNDNDTMSLISVNIALQDVQVLLNGLHYGDVYVRASNQWLYVSENKFVATAPVRRFRRFPLIAWDQIGSGNTIIEGSGSAVAKFNPSTIHTDGQHVYYWDDDLKRIAE